MIEIKKIVTPSPEQWQITIEGMRNAKNSWHNSDSYATYIENPETGNAAPFQFNLGEDDLDLMRRLCSAGSEHRKYLRYLPVHITIVAPLYWWKEFETYRVGVADCPPDIDLNSCSTMHKLDAKPFETSDFSREHMDAYSLHRLQDTVRYLNEKRDALLKAETPEAHNAEWWQLIQMLPNCYNQQRTLVFNYEVVVNMVRQRERHKLDEWREFVAILKSRLPYLADIMEGDRRD